MIKLDVVVEKQMAQVVEEQQMANETNQKRSKIVHTCSNALHADFKDWHRIHSRS